MQKDSFAYNGNNQRPMTAEAAKKQQKQLADKVGDLKTKDNVKCGGRGWNNPPLSLGAGSWLITIKDGQSFASWSVISLHADGTMVTNDSSQVVQPKAFADYTTPIGSWCLLNKCGKWKGTTIDFTAEPNCLGTGVTGRVTYCGDFDSCDCDDYNRVDGTIVVDFFEKAPDALCCDKEPIFSLGPFCFEGQKMSCVSCNDN